MKKLIGIVIILVAGFMTYWFFINEEELLELNVESNIEQAPLFYDQSNIVKGSEITIIAGQVQGYTFKHWIHSVTEVILSSEAFYTFMIEEDLNVKAVYEQITQDPNGDDPNDDDNDDPNDDDPIGDDPDDSIEIERYRYTIDFEDVSKDNYNLGVLNFYDIPFVFYDAMIGSTAQDQKRGERSVRLRNGMIQPSFSFTGLTEISFSAAKFLNSDGGTFAFEYSFDNTTWHQYGTVREAPDDFATYIYRFDESFYTAIDEEEGKPVYFRIVSEDDYLINIDNLRIILGSEGKINFPDDHRITIDVESDHPFISASKTPSGNIRMHDTVSISTTDFEGYVFSHWLDVHTNTIFSYHQEHTFDVKRPLLLRAMFERE